MSEASEMLTKYLAQIGLSRPVDGMQQVQITLLRQWVSHLEDVLQEVIPQPQAHAVRRQIIREMIYGAVPSAAEMDVRKLMEAEMLDMARRTPPVPM